MPFRPNSPISFSSGGGAASSLTRAVWAITSLTFVIFDSPDERFAAADTAIKGPRSDISGLHSGVVIFVCHDCFGGIAKSISRLLLEIDLGYDRGGCPGRFTLEASRA